MSKIPNAFLHPIQYLKTPRAEWLLAKAKAYESTQHYKKAAQNYGKFLTLKANPDILEAKIQMDLACGNFKALSKAFELHPEIFQKLESEKRITPKHCIELGKVSFRQNGFDAAIAWFGKALDRSSSLEEKVDARLHLLLAFTEQKEYSKALGEFYVAEKLLKEKDIASRRTLLLYIDVNRAIHECLDNLKEKLPRFYHKEYYLDRDANDIMIHPIIHDYTYFGPNHLMSDLYSFSLHTGFDWSERIRN